MKKIYPCFIFLILANTYACKSNPAQVSHPQGSVVIMVDPIKSYDSIKLSNGVYLTNQAQICFINRYYQEEITELNYINQPDTLIIKGDNRRIILGIRFYDSEWLYYMFDQGDTIHIKYNCGFPFCYLANRSCLPYDINYQLLKRLHFGQTKPLSLYYQFLSGFDGTNNSKLFYQSKYNDYNLETRFLDSVFQTGQISKENYSFYKENLRYSLLNLKKGMQQAGVITDLELFKIQKTDLRNENMLKNSNYQWFLKDYINNELRFSKLKTVHGGIFYDSRANYDSVRGNSIFSSGIRTFLLLNYFQEICEKGSASDVNTYFKKFVNDISDTSLVAYIKKKYMIHEAAGMSVSPIDLLLADNNGVKTTLKNLLDSLKGKVVVVDFWASWCAPCRQLMPRYHSLINDFSGQPVVFIFLSTDKDKNAWIKASIKENIHMYDYNYLILATENSFTETIQLKSIPRTVIFDKNGSLVCKDAPHADSPLLLDMIRNYLIK